MASKKVVSQSYEKDNRKETRTAEAVQFSDLQDVLVNKFKGSAEKLVEYINKLEIDAAELNAYQQARLAIVGFSDKVVKEARRLYRRALRLGKADYKPETAFEKAKLVMSDLGEVESLEFDDSIREKIIATKSDEDDNE